MARKHTSGHGWGCYLASFSRCPCLGVHSGRRSFCGLAVTSPPAASWRSVPFAGPPNREGPQLLTVSSSSAEAALASPLCCRQAPPSATSPPYAPPVRPGPCRWCRRIDMALVVVAAALQGPRLAAARVRRLRCPLPSPSGRHPATGATWSVNSGCSPAWPPPPVLASCRSSLGGCFLK